MGPVSFTKARAAGLRARSVADTVKATLSWWPSEFACRERVTAELFEQAKRDGKEVKTVDPKALCAGISRDRQARVLKAWHEREKKESHE